MSIETELRALRAAVEALTKRLDLQEAALLRLPEAARRLGISRRELGRLVRDGIITTSTLKPGGRAMISASEIARVVFPAAKAKAPKRSARKLARDIALAEAEQLRRELRAV